MAKTGRYPALVTCATAAVALAPTAGATPPGIPSTATAKSELAALTAANGRIDDRLLQ